uniref:Uncharacterized protein n=1 Tax=Arundo donax TaxID=35708 RepID=A0A0A9GH24_ARUDO
MVPRALPKIPKTQTKKLHYYCTNTTYGVTLQHQPRAPASLQATVKLTE